MGFLEKLKRARMHGRAVSWGKWCARVMTLGFLATKNEYKGVAPTYAWLARRTLMQRNHWKQLSETDFRFEKSGEEIAIRDEMNLLQVIHSVIDIEYGHALTHLSPVEREALLDVAHGAANEVVFGKKGGTN